MSENGPRPPAPDLSLLGLARRSGRLEVGFEAVRRALGTNKVHLLVLAQDLSAGTLGKFKASSAHEGIPVIKPASKQELGRALGRREAGIVAILDEGFSKALITRFGVQTEVSVERDARI